MAFSITEDMIRVFRERGLEGLQEECLVKLKEWKSLSMNIAVIGQSGAGKSALINALRHKTNKDDGYAPVGSNETTINIRRYTHPDNDKLVLTDVPGVGTTSFPQATYMEKIKVDTYDFFLLLASKHLLEQDVWLAQELTKRRKGFFLVRTHTAVSVTNVLREIRCSETEALESIRAGTLGRGNQFLTEHKLFLLDSYETQKYEFNDFSMSLIGDFPEIKKEALLLTIRTEGDLKMIEMKVQHLKKRTWIAATISGAAAAVPVPGVGIVVDAGILVEETCFYFKQLGFDRDSVSRFAQRTGVEENTLKKSIKRELGITAAAQVTKDTIFEVTKYLGINVAAYMAETATEEVVKYFPVVGPVFAASASYLMTRWFLGQILDKMHIAANRVFGV